MTDSGTEVAALITMADYERLHEHADIADALRLQRMRETPFETMPLSEMMTELGIDPEAVLAS